MKCENDNIEVYPGQDPATANYFLGQHAACQAIVVARVSILQTATLDKQSATGAFGAEHLGPFGKRQRLEVPARPGVVQPGEGYVRRTLRGSLPRRIAA
jgi:hypothetical protein